jgi:hypothetical protein
VVIEEILFANDHIGASVVSAVVDINIPRRLEALGHVELAPLNRSEGVSRVPADARRGFAGCRDPLRAGARWGDRFQS